ncbi:DNA-3-methyladenine glycosylase family protein [Kutzneria kofuensis]|uniref:3-methyladenine DNA glycosylase/8-oxoguanine DNA glycosylase n=1 Tax=Kutzneria kofuensis TaxID=103725 RepID=A0A7W9KJD3_9PSEU|nr:DNA-3-methyladenine glycosylase 2 family protein [Kutzneria kofuensis]MBB5893547.1 3-methyladenine DNA glycosylase/8-oxoguanine DNA glycosylase [Kutzneria kofuensis]
MDAVTRRWTPDYPLDIGGVVGPLRRGAGDPAFQVAADGALWLTGNAASGPASLELRRQDGEVVARAWGDGAEELLDGVPQLLGADDEPEAFEAHHELIRETRRRMPGLRLGRTNRVWDSLVPAILEQKVTGYEARRSWRDLCRRYGRPAPGPAPVGMRVPPTPKAILGITDWEWHKAGVDGQRRRTLLNAAAAAHALTSKEKLRLIPGIGVWTTAEVAQRAWGDPDEVSVGDFHIPSVVGWALVGRALDDDGMLEVLEPYRPQRQRAVRYIEASGFRKPRFAPRYAARDYRAI